MKRIRIFFIRNAEHALAGKSWPLHETGLSDVGKYQAIDIGKELGKLDIANIYSSTRRRAMATAEPTARRIGKEPIPLPGFDAINHGSYAGCDYYSIGRQLASLYDEINSAPNPEQDYLETKETLQSVADRSWLELNSVVKTAPDGTSLAIFTHDVIIAALLCRMNDIPLKNIWWWGGREQHPTRYGSITDLTYSSGKWTLIKFACTAHLDKG